MSSKERGRARPDGDDGRTGLDWMLNGAPNDVNTDDRATSVAADGDGGGNTPCVWLDVGNVDDELSTLVDQKVAGEIRDSDFRVALSRLLDIKHARSVADIEDEALQRKNAYRRHASWTAGTSMENVEKATTSRRYRARATREALEENRRSNVENTRGGDDNDYSNSNSNNSHRQEERGGCSLGQEDGIAEGDGGRETLPRDMASDGRPGQRIGREGLPPPGRRTPPGRRRTLSGLLTSSSSGPPTASLGGYLKEPRASSSRSTSSSSSRSSSISSISSIGGYGLPEETPERILSGGAMSIGTGALFFDCNSSGFGIVPKTAAPPRNWRPPPAGTSGAGHRYQLAASGAVAGDSRWNARSGSPPSASGTGIVGAKQQRKKQHEQQQQQRAQQGLTSTSAAATATAGTPDLHESAGGTSTAESGFDGIPQENRRSETSGGNDAGSAFDWTPATTGLLGRPSGMYPFLHSDDQNNGLGSDGAGFHTREAFAPNAGANASVGEQTSLSSQPATGGVKGEDRGRERSALAAAAGALPVAETLSAGSPEQVVEGSTMIADRSPPEATATATQCTCAVS